MMRLFVAVLLLASSVHVVAQGNDVVLRDVDITIEKFTEANCQGVSETDDIVKNSCAKHTSTQAILLSGQCKTIDSLSEYEHYLYEKTGSTVPTDLSQACKES